jgi:hypothetical protein
MRPRSEMLGGYSAYPISTHHNGTQEKNDTPMRMSFPIDLLPKVLVIGYQNPILRKGFLDDGFIIQTTCLIVYGENLVQLFMQPFCNGRPSALIHKETHLCRLHD